MKLKKLLIFLSLLGVLGVILVGCTQKSGEDTSSKVALTVATDSDTAPFTYKKGEDFKGYDIDVVKAIFKNSKEYDVTFVTTAFDSILAGLDADRYQIAANDFNYNEQRAEKYLFSDPISKSNYAIVSAKGSEYDSLDDLSGKVTEVIPGSNYAQVLENWNEVNKDKAPIEIQYAANSTGLSTRVLHIETGKIDFILYDAISAAFIVEDQSYDLKVTKVTDTIGGKTDGLEYLLFADTKEGKELQTYVNKRLEELKEDGTLVKLSQGYFGDDYVSNIE
ncbi:transporter substrate-binding domain-containing protein [Streptococcus sp. S784/96/1]|uniref:transporter substrate-binding domain-containing protein n=1 Tax=Streptococcus sp. S784/96/1 TaxID=2653499 RepID=UPI0013866BB3|nr:transporter substrate-binding domain-containing protein [Streptococcus sp. S784/96/1]